MSLCLCGFIFLSACSELEKPKTEPFYAETAPPLKQEFRWSNGRMPKSFDPALASAPPETDIVRAVFEGLTEMDAKTLQEVPAAAERWTASEDFKTWTFYLRKNAKWSNGNPVTAKDFARSWKRLAETGEKVSHRHLLNNIAGMNIKTDPRVPDFLMNQPVGQNLPSLHNQPDGTNVNNSQNKEPQQETDGQSPSADKSGPKKISEETFGVEAVDELILKVSLIKPDKDFPKLVANQIFRPVFGDGKEFEEGKLNAAIVTNGPFRVFSIGQDGITLDRSEHYWNKQSITLERVRFVPKETAEQALEAYRAGDIDAVTNADFEPLALKLLTPYDDFRRTTHGALNFYEFNLKKPPFNDRRVREALAIAIERERLTEGAMEGSTRPALSFLPFDFKDSPKLSQDVEKAKDLIEDAGFKNGENFPVIKLLVNRNDTQLRIARSVAKMWKQNLNIETEIVVKEPAEIEAARKTGDFDLLRRGVVLPTTDEMVNLLAIFGIEDKLSEETTTDSESYKTGTQTKDSGKETPSNENQQPDEDNTILTEEAAIFELRAIPLYFPTSYSLVKPYVQGFEINSLDAPSLKDVVIDNAWQPRK